MIINFDNYKTNGILPSDTEIELYMYNRVTTSASVFLEKQDALKVGLEVCKGEIKIYNNTLLDANGNENFSFERSALDEGVADYFATSYSRAINPFRWEHIYSWDGNNEFWSGRVANTALNYPNGGNIYALGEIWNAAMSNIYTDLGQIVSDKLMLESLYFFTNNTTLPEAALYILQADSLLFNGQHSNTICNRFAEKNIFDANCKPTFINNISQLTDDIEIINTYGFLTNNEKIKIQFENAKSGYLKIFDMSGACCFKQHFQNENNLFLSAPDLKKGVYILQIKYDDKVKNVKIVK